MARHAKSRSSAVLKVKLFAFNFTIPLQHDFVSMLCSIVSEINDLTARFVLSIFFLFLPTTECDGIDSSNESLTGLVLVIKVSYHAPDVGRLGASHMNL